MGFFTSKEFQTWEDLFLEQIQDLYDAESRLVKALPKMSEAAQTRELKSALTAHLRETETHVGRLEQIFRDLGKEPKRVTCEGIRGLISEGDEMIRAKGDTKVKDAALIAAAQRVEHYEIGSYGTVRALAELLGYREAMRLLDATLEEEKNADRKLSAIAEGSLYRRQGDHKGGSPTNGKSQRTKATRKKSTRKTKQKSSTTTAGRKRKRAMASAR